METSSVSPERAETMVPKPAALPAAQRGARLGHGAGLVRLDQHRVAGAVARGRLDPRGAGGQVVVADDLHPVARGAREGDPALAVVLAERVLDGHDRIAVEPAEQQRRRGRRGRARGRRARAGSGRRARTRTRRCRARSPPRRPARSRRARSRAPAWSALPRCWRTPARSRPRRPRPASLPASRHQLAGRAIDLGGHVQRLGEGRGAGGDHHQVLDVDAPPGVRAAAEDLDLGQRQRDRTVAGEMAPQRHGRARPPPRARRPATSRPWRCRRGGPCSGVPSSAISAASTPAWSVASRPASAVRDRRRRRWRRACVTSRPPKRGPPSRRSIASREPRDAPAGAIARPAAPAGERDLGLDRRPPARVPDPAARTADDGRSGHGVVLHRPPCDALSLASTPSASAAIAASDATGATSSVAREGADRAPCRASAGQVLDRRLAVDARQHQPRQQRRRARLERRRRLPRARARSKRATSASNAAA